MAMLNNQMVIHLELDSVFKGNLHPTSSPSPCWFCVGSAWLEPLTITTVHMSKIWTYQCMWFIHHVHPSFINLVFQNNLEIWHVYNRHLELNQTRVRPCEMRHLGFDSPLPPPTKNEEKTSAALRPRPRPRHVRAAVSTEHLHQLWLLGSTLQGIRSKELNGVLHLRLFFW